MTLINHKRSILDLREIARSQGKSERAKTVFSERKVAIATLKEEKQFAAGQIWLGYGGALRQVEYNISMQQKKLYRSRDDKMLTGLSAGIAKYFNQDPTIIRIAFIVLEFATAGLLIIGYLIVAIIVPKEPESLNNK